MKILNEQSIRKLFPARFYERGEAYFKQGRVIGLSYNQAKQSWFAEVNGSEVYYVDVNLDELDAGKIKPYCECPAFEAYKSCKHLAAVLLAIIAEGQAEPSRQANTLMARNFLNGVVAGQQVEVDVLTDKLPMQVKYILTLDHAERVTVGLKTGIKHQYVVRNIREFLDNVLEGQGHIFTGKFSYLPDEHFFLQQDVEILQQLRGFILAGDLYTERSYYAQGTYDKRDVLVPPLAFDTLLNRLIERDVGVEIDNKLYSAITVLHDETPMGFMVTHDADAELILKMSGMEKTHLFKHYGFIFAEGTFYFPTQEQLKVMEETKKLRMFQNELPISKDMADSFFSEALPVLKKAAPVEISEKVSEEIIELPLEAKLFLEENDDSIIGKLTYHYGSYEMDPFSENPPQDVIIIRDMEKEERIMRLIEQSNFRYNGKKLYIRMDNDEELYHFLYTILPILDDHVQLFLTSQIRGMIVEYEPLPSTSVNVQTDSNLLEIGFDVSGVDDSEVQQIIQAVIEKKRYYRLDSGALVSLEGEEYQSLQQFFTDINVKQADLQDGKVVLPAYRGAQIDELLETKKSYDPSFRKLLHQLKAPEEQVYPLPEGLQADLRDYQITGYQWFKSLSNYHLGGILADDMGLGKTLQTISYLLSEPSEHPHLIVVPSSVVYNWRNECNRFAPTLDVAIIAGSPEERQQIIEESGDKQVWITSYGTVRKDVEIYAEMQFQTLILDEAQYIKNYATKVSQAVREIKASRRFALSGTPIENSVDELWAIFQVVLPGLMPSQREFRQLEAGKIASLTRPFILRRLKGDVLKELPDKIESVHVSELTKDQKELYVGYLQQLKDEAKKSLLDNSFQKNRMKILAGLTRLRQLCCHPSLFIENYTGESGKLNELLETIQNMRENGKRMLIFSQFTSMHEIIIKELEKLDIEHFYLHGGTPAADRVEMSNAFNAGEKDVFLISLRAGGTGLNLTGADTVILYDLWWNPAVEDQAAGRAHRFGQKNVVQVMRFITEGTIEEKIYELQQKKRELIDQIIQPGEAALSSLSEDDIRELLSI